MAKRNQPRYLGELALTNRVPYLLREVHAEGEGYNLDAPEYMPAGSTFARAQSPTFPNGVPTSRFVVRSRHAA